MTFARAPFVINIRLYAYDLERGKETVVDAFFQAVLINRLAKIIDIGYVRSFLRRCGHTDLRGRGEVFQHFTPTALFFCAAAMALIHDNEIKKILIKELLIVRKRFFVRLFFGRLVPDKLLIEGEIYLMGRDRGAVVFCKIDLMDNLFEWLKISAYRLIDKIIAVGKVKYLLLYAALQQAIHDLKGGIGFPCSRRHDKQNAVLPLCDGVYCAVDGNLLIISRRISVLACIIWLIDEGKFFLR